MITKQELETIRSKAPFLSEGVISPSAVFEMGKNERKQYEINKQIRFKAETEFKEQNKTPEEKAQEKREQEEKEKISKINQLKSQISFLKNFPQIKSKRNNKLKTTYLNYIQELEFLK